MRNYSQLAETRGKSTDLGSIILIPVEGEGLLELNVINVTSPPSTTIMIFND